MDFYNRVITEVEFRKRLAEIFDRKNQEDYTWIERTKADELLFDISIEVDKLLEEAEERGYIEGLADGEADGT